MHFAGRDDFGMTEAPSPIQWLSDNGSPYIAGDTRAFAKELGLVPLTTPIESPQSNGMAEAFVNTLKRDYVSVNPTPDAGHKRKTMAPGGSLYEPACSCTVHPKTVEDLTSTEWLVGGWWAPGASSPLSHPGEGGMQRQLGNFIILVGMVVSLVPTPSLALKLVNTGEPTGIYAWGVLGEYYCPPELPGCAQWLGAEFTLDKRARVTSIEGFIQSYNQGFETGGVVHASIYSDGGDIPGNKLFSAPFDVPSGIMGGDWFGPSKLDLFFPKGTYWVVFEVDDQSTFSGGMLCCAPDPLSVEAFYSGFQGQWTPMDRPRPFAFPALATSPQGAACLQAAFRRLGTDCEMVHATALASSILRPSAASP